MICSISGEVAKNPVIGIPTGLVYERSLIEKGLRLGQGKCPVSNISMDIEKDLLAIKPSIPVIPSSVALRTSNPMSGNLSQLMDIFQNEWDLIMLENFKLRQELDTTRKELSEALYNHEAACRVIAYLTKERNEARAALELVGGDGSALKRTEAAIPTNSVSVETTDDSLVGSKKVKAISSLDSKTKENIKSTAKSLLKLRKKRSIARNELPSTEQVKNWKNQKLEISDHAALISVDTHEASLQTLFGFVDGTAALFSDHNSENKILWLPSPQEIKGVVTVLINCCFDFSGEFVIRLFAARGAIITRISDGQTLSSFIEPSIQYCASLKIPNHFLVGTKSTLSVMDSSDPETPSLSIPCPDSPASSFSSVAVHPDGILVAAGDERSGDLMVWNLSNPEEVNRLKAHSASITSIAFSENGIYCATCSLDQTIVIWNLKDTSQPMQTIQIEGGGIPICLKFDFSGVYLAIGMTNGSIQIAYEREADSMFELLLSNNSHFSYGGGEDSLNQLREICFAPKARKLYTAGTLGLKTFS